MAQLRTVPFDTLLALSTLFSIGTALPGAKSTSSPSLTTRMEMPDSPPPPPDGYPPPPSSYWNFATSGLPVSYRIAIVIDAFVLIVTIVSLCLLGWYMRRQFRRRRLQAAIHERQRDDTDLGLKMREMSFDMEEGKVEGKIRASTQVREVGLGIGIVKKGKEKKDRRKKGHVRWGSGVQGGSVDLNTQGRAQSSSSPSLSPTATVEVQSSFLTPNRQSGKGRLSMDFGSDSESATSPRLSTGGYRVNPLGVGKAKSSPMAAEFKGDPLGRAGGMRLWEEEKERQRRVGQKAVAGYRSS